MDNEALTGFDFGLPEVSLDSAPRRQDREPAPARAAVAVIPDVSLSGAPGSASRHRAGLWLAAAQAVITAPSGPWHARPESLASHAAYVRSRSWVPDYEVPDCTPPPARGRITGPAGAWYGHLIARPAIAAGYTVAWVLARPSRLTLIPAVVAVIRAPSGPWRGQPESLASHAAYVRSRSWVPEVHEGSLLGLAGAVYGHTIARAGLITGYSLAWVAARPLRLIITAGAAGGIALGFLG